MAFDLAFVVLLGVLVYRFVQRWRFGRARFYFEEGPPYYLVRAVGPPLAGHAGCGWDEVGECGVVQPRDRAGLSPSCHQVDNRGGCQVTNNPFIPYLNRYTTASPEHQAAFDEFITQAPPPSLT